MTWLVDDGGETGKRTCVECRLCLDAPALRRGRLAIGFAIHGQQADRVHLPVVTTGAAA